MNDAAQHNADVQFMKECVISGVVKLIMSERGASIEDAMQLFYTSQTFARLDNEQTLLYTQSPLYVYDMLTTEIG